MSTRVCTKLCGCVCVCVCERESYPVLSMHNDVNCSCGSCWTPIQHVVFFPSFFMFRRSAMESMIMVTFTPFVLSVHLFHTPPFFTPPTPPASALYSSILLSRAPLCCLCSPLTVSASLISVFSSLPAPLALPPGRGGTVMFMKPFNVLCNYPGNTSHHYSRQ